MQLSTLPVPAAIATTTTATDATTTSTTATFFTPAFPERPATTDGEQLP